MNIAAVATVPAPDTATAKVSTSPRAAKSLSGIHYAAIALGGLMACLALVIYVPRLFTVSTDDAYVQADTVTIVPKVAAYVATLHVSDNSSFTKGELLVELDPRDYKVALESAKADLATAMATTANITAQIDEQHHVVSAAEAAVSGDQATLTFSQEQQTRYEALSRDGADTKERSQLARTDVAQHLATLQHDAAALAAARSHIQVLESQLGQAQAAVEKAQSSVDQAELNLSYTRIYAPSSGTVANKTVQAGNYVQPGQALFAAVPKDIFVVANIKETQVGRVQVGQPVTFTVDSLPGKTFHGHVDSFQRGTGSNFALLPPENATGNFIKIVQRVPVKIVLDANNAGANRLSPGMSVIAHIKVR
jgi:membrane fusion protein, multidrug efflux system